MFATNTPLAAAMMSTSPEVSPAPAAPAAFSPEPRGSGFPVSVIAPRFLRPCRLPPGGTASLQDVTGGAAVNGALPHISLSQRATVPGAAVPAPLRRGFRMSVAARPPFTGVNAGKRKEAAQHGRRHVEKRRPDHQRRAHRGA